MGKLSLTCFWGHFLCCFSEAAPTHHRRVLVAFPQLGEYTPSGLTSVLPLQAQGICETSTSSC